MPCCVHALHLGCNQGFVTYSLSSADNFAIKGNVWDSYELHATSAR